ncbi:hypothetical protein ABES03_03330 [Neobacillus rhizosphaerae]|uniref:hypothetical protein n=1 Tax=Neobacillus rhizosphaerae TaxID=2880965 RepID=UPI003D2C045D
MGQDSYGETWEVQDENTPRDKIIGNWGLSLSKDGQNLGPVDIKSTSKHTKERNIETIKLPDEPGYYVGQISIGTPSGRIEYVFKFNIK